MYKRSAITHSVVSNTSKEQKQEVRDELGHYQNPMAEPNSDFYTLMVSYTHSEARSVSKNSENTLLALTYSLFVLKGLKK